MKLLQLFADAGWEFPKSPRIKEYFYNKLKREGEDEFLKVLYWLGSRGYNELLDYSLFAIKISNHLSRQRYSFDQYFEFDKVVIDNLIPELLFGDRHDLSQNAPYYFNDIIKSLENEDDKKKFKEFLCNAIIECINVNGTGDTIFKMSVKED